jgi:hypothetical protein
MPTMSSSGTWFSLHDVGTSVGNAFHNSATEPPFWTRRISSNEAGLVQGAQEGDRVKTKCRGG